MWQFFQWAWNLSWGDGIALMICLFVFWYGKKWIDQKFGTDCFSKRQVRQLKTIMKCCLVSRHLESGQTMS